ncbi:MAG: ATP-binding cassette domain-containing protein [Thermaerobacter sp.]|jgi:simple sugar transport system ATP-binding protein|nr:ATP-binding cassette domain-containing protein [Thermaerobacter sp.]
MSVQAAAEADASGKQEPLLSVRSLSKAFGRVRAVDGVSLDIYPQEIIGIVGDNGAGKSVFLQLLTGNHRADAGEIIFKGQRVQVTSPKVSRRRLRIEMVYQNLSLAPDLRVWENAFLGEERRRCGIFMDVRAMQEATGEALVKLGAKVQPNDLFSDLSGGEQQVVAISRAILFQRELIILDEPTAAISLNKVEEVLRTILDLKQHGKTVLLVSHRLEDIVRVSDRIVVFAHGRIKRVLRNEGIRVGDLIPIMFGND